jgi:ABC-type Mn2+/Zn2+ transport system permease subunit
MVDFLHYGFMQRALLSAVLVGTTCSVIGVFVVLRGMAFAGSGLAHAAFGGVALGFLVGMNPLLAAVLFCLGTAGLIHAAGTRGRLSTDSAIGIFFAFAMALGVLFIGLSRRYDARVYGYLFGNVLGVTPGSLLLSAALGVVVLGAVALWFKELQFLAFDEEMARASGLRTGALSALLLGLLALTVVLSIRSVGLILIEALLVTPAATAYQLTNRYGLMFVLSWAAGVVACVAGLVISFYLQVPSGAAIVIVSTALFGLAALFSPKRRPCKACGRAAS